MRRRLAFIASLALATPAFAQLAGDPAVHAACEAHANALFEALDAANYDAATGDFDAALKARYPAAKLQQDYESLPAQYGKMMGRGRPHVGDLSGHAIVMAPLIFERGTLTAEVHCNGDGGVTDLKLLPTQAMAPAAP